VSVIYLAKRYNSYFRDSDDLAEVKLNGNGALADADATKEAEDAEAKRKAEEAEAEARRKKEDEERDVELTAYYKEQWANEDEAATALLPPLLRWPRCMRQM
jgi:solute carrier family 23 (nucleobase transporter), member 1